MTWILGYNALTCNHKKAEMLAPQPMWKKIFAQTKYIHLEFVFDINKLNLIYLSFLNFLF